MFKSRLDLYLFEHYSIYLLMQDSHIHIGSLYQLFSEETQPFRKVHRMIDLFESIIKSHSVVILSEYVNHNQLSEAAKGMLSVGLRTPSLGTWQLFARVLFEELKVQGYEWSFADFPDEFTALDKALNVDKTNVIAFRNSYAHGATPTDEQCKADVLKFEPFLVKLLSSKWLLNTVTEFRDGKVWISSKSKALCAHPLLVHKSEDGAPIAFFNDLKNDKVGLLNYPLSKHYREKEFYSEFHEYLPLNEWKKTGSSDFTQRIEELTETFKGRIAERAKIHDFVLSKSKGYLSIQGNPGIGKSALIAQVFKEIKSSKEVKQVHCIEYFIRRGTQQADVDYLLNYLIKRTDEVFSQGREIRAEGKMTFDLQNQLFSKWRLWAEHSQGKKLLFLIDGLDEGVEKNVLTYMPRENFENILIIYGSRPGGHKSIDELWSTLPPEHHICLQLEGLSIADIRALIYDVANKYELERESVWVDAVQQRSQGNPLYLRLLCNAIENGSIALNDLNALPKEIDEYYKAILSRYAQDMIDGDALLAGLFTFAAAKDYLTMAHLGLTNQLGDATIQRIGSTLKEVLYENPLTDGVLDYQLFHESFREYLVKEKAKQVNDAAERILHFCASWESLEGTWEQRYALEHYASHLSESQKEVRAKELWGLLENSKYKETQKKVLKHYDASRDLARIGILKASELKQFDLQLECALQLVDLKYEEANDAPQVVALVADGEIDLALKRIESFGGTDQEGVRRRFILYMLCLMELTLLDSKTKPHSRASIEKLLNHLDEKIPTDNSIIAWKNFFPSKLMFFMATKWAEMCLDFYIVYKRTDTWDSNWISEMGPFTDVQFEIFHVWVREINDFGWKFNLLNDIIVELIKQGKVNEALTYARGISDEIGQSSRALTSVSEALAKQGKVKEAIDCAGEISVENYKFRALASNSAALAKLGNSEEALDFARSISEDLVKCNALISISSELTKLRRVEKATSVLLEALEFARCISENFDKCKVLVSIYTELINQGKTDDASCVIQEAIGCALGYNNYAFELITGELINQGKFEQALKCANLLEKSLSEPTFHMEWALEMITGELIKQGEFKKALECARDISSDFKKGIALVSISCELFNQGENDQASSVMRESLDCVKVEEIKVHNRAQELLREISIVLARHGKITESLECAQAIKYIPERDRTLRSISRELVVKRELVKALECTFCIQWNDVRNQALTDIFTEMINQEMIADVFLMMLDVLKRRVTFNVSEEARFLKKISVELVKRGMIEECLICARAITTNEYIKCISLIEISSDLENKGKAEMAYSVLKECKDIAAESIHNIFSKSEVMQLISREIMKYGKTEEALNFAQEIFNSSFRYKAFNDISLEYAKHGKLQEALLCAEKINDVKGRINALQSISMTLFNHGYSDHAINVLQISIDLAMSVDDDIKKSGVLQSISGKLAKQGHIEQATRVLQESYECAKGIDDDMEKSKILQSISGKLFVKGHIEQAACVLQESLECARGIIDNLDKSSALKAISHELVKQENWLLAESVGQEIPVIAERHDCWKILARNLYKEMGWQRSLRHSNQLKSEEGRMYYLKGWAGALNMNNSDKICIQEALCRLVDDSESIELLLKKHALTELFFNTSNPDKFKRLSNTLNIQWAMEIAAKFPNNESISRFSYNIEAWLNEVADEDDREQIELWAKQVVKGKITEEEFGQRVSEI